MKIRSPKADLKEGESGMPRIGVREPPDAASSRHWRAAWLAAILSIPAPIGSTASEIPVFVFAGQSIAINSGTDSGLLPAGMLALQTNVLFFNARAHFVPTSEVHWHAYQPPTGPGWSSDCGCPNPQGSFGPEITTANRISIALYGGTTVAVFKYAVGATSLHKDWNPTMPGSLYKDMLARLMEALDVLPRETGFAGRIAGVFWTQGESDALDGPGTASAYATNLWQLVTAMRQDFLQASLPFVYGRILPEWPNAIAVRSAQEGLPLLLRDVCMVNADDFWTPTLHYNNEGTIELGKRYAAGLESIFRSRRSLEIFADSGSVRLRISGLPFSRWAAESADSVSGAEWHQIADGQSDILGFSESGLLPLEADMRFYRLAIP